MAEKKTKLKSSKKLVEAPPEHSENVELSTEQSVQAELPAQVDSMSAEVARPEFVATPQAVLKNKSLSALKFTLITFAVAAIPYILAPGFLLPAFNHPVVRSCLMIVLTWNLVGAALYANVQTRQARVFLFLVFALPLMTIGLWWMAPIYGMSVFETMWKGH